MKGICVKHLSLLMLCIGALPSLLTPQTGHAVQFTSSFSRYIVVPYAGVLAPTSAITVEAWIRADTLSGSPSIISKTELGGYALYGAGGTLRFDVRLSGVYRTVSVNGNGLLKQWHHVAATSDGRYTRLYIDGTLSATDDAGGTFPIQYSVTNGLIFGAEASTGNTANGGSFDGALDEIRIWNVMRTGTEIAAYKDTLLSGSESGLIGYWRLDEGSGSSTGDLTANNNDGQFINSPVWILSDVTLPVELTGFSAERNGGTAHLRWSTASEQNNHGFEVERSESNRRSGATMDRWISLAFIPGQGTTSAPQSYSYLDRSVHGAARYRLKQIDRDGTFRYSSIIEMDGEAVPSGFRLAQNFPNPFNPATTITFTLAEGSFTTLTVYDILGRTVARLAAETLPAGTHQRRFSAEHLSSGSYVYALTSGGRTISRMMNILQ